MTSIGYLQIDCFAVAVERRQRPELCNHPIVIGGYPQERKTVYDASAEARALGVKPGLPLREAQQLCPAAVFLPLPEGRYQEATVAFRAVVESFSPAVEPALPGSAYFDATGLTQLFGPPEQLGRRLTQAIAQHLGLVAQAGLGPTRLTAQIAARLATPGGTLVVAEPPIVFLSEHSIEALGNALDHIEGADAYYERLRLLGIRTIGEFLLLPFPELMEQFGPAGVAAYHLIHGNADPPLLPNRQPAALAQLRRFDPPLTDGTSLEKEIERLSATIATALQARYEACQTVILRLDGEDGATLEETAQLKAPTAQAKNILAAALRAGGRLASEIANLPGITTIQIVATGFVPAGGTQLDLFDAHRQKRARLAEAEAEVRRRFGVRLKRAEAAAPAGGVAALPFVLRDYFDGS